MSAREVELSGDGPWGFRMHGGTDQNQPLRISRVNPGSKASISGVREGDVISSINSRPTRTMSNAEAHAMLRNAGPVLKLGLNEDREMSPRRRSIGRSNSELKRPTHLLSYREEAIPQAPVYATIRPPISQQKSASPLKLPPTSTPSSTSTGLPSGAAEEPLKFHPTNPFYSTLPSQSYSSASKLPIPNGKTIFSSLERNKSTSKTNDSNSTSSIYNTNDYHNDVTDFSRLNVDKEYLPNPIRIKTNGFENTSNEKSNEYVQSHINGMKTEEINGVHAGQNNIHFFGNPNGISDAKNPEDKEDPFEKYIQKLKEKNSYDSPKSESKSPNSDLKQTRKEIHTSTITEHKIDRVEEIKTIKKFVFNGCSDADQNGSNSSAEETPRSRPTTVLVSLPKSPVNPGPVLSPAFSPTSTKTVWRPGAPTPPPAPSSPAVSRSTNQPSTATSQAPPPPPLPVWSPNSAGASPVGSRKSFRPVHFEDSPPARRKLPNDTLKQENGCISGSEIETRLRTSQSAPASGLNTLGAPSPTSSRYPKAPNPTVTLLQKAREGQLPRGSSYLQESVRLPRDRVTPPRNDPVHALRREYASEGEAERGDYERGGIRKMADAQRKVEGIGPITKDGMPVALRSEVKDPSRWYKKMYDTIHKNKYDDDYVTIRYKNNRGQSGLQRSPVNKSQYAYFDPRSGYLSEPEGGLHSTKSSNWSDAYDSDATSGPRRRTASVQEERRLDEEPLSPYLPSNKYSTLASARASHEVYKNQPGRIEDYVPGKSSVVDKEAKQWWDEVMDIFDGWLDENSPLPPYGTLLARAIQKNQLSSTTSLPQASPKDKKDVTSAILSKSNMARALKESGYESDSTLVFRKREDTDGPLSPAERRAAYRDLQAGGEPPLRGFRSPAPPKQDDSEIEYIPISPTLTKIRVHKKVHKPKEVICYPLQYTQDRLRGRSLDNGLDRNRNASNAGENPPAPPRRISSKHSKTLKLISSTKPSNPVFPTEVKDQSKVEFLKDKLHNKLTRQNTHTIIRNSKSTYNLKMATDTTVKQKRIASTSAPPTIGRKNDKIISPVKNIKKPLPEPKNKGTSSFSSPRRTLLPTEYTNPIYTKYGENNSKTVHGSVGRKTPITNILDQVTSLDKLWSSESRCDGNPASQTCSKNATTPKSLSKPTSKLSTKSLSYNNLNRGRDMLRTSEKIKKSKPVNGNFTVSQTLRTTSTTNTNIIKSCSNINLHAKSQPIKTAIVTNLKTKSPTVKPRVVPCHASCSSKNKETIQPQKNTKLSPKKSSKSSEFDPQFGNVNEMTISNEDFMNYHQNKIKTQRDNILGDCFFQHLFLNQTHPPSKINTCNEQNTSVLQKAKMFQSYPQDYTIPRSLNSYLLHRKPVSQSRFKMWDRYPSPEKLVYPRSISWPGRMHNDIRKFESLSGDYEDFGSTSSLNTVRSKSEPPTTKMFFSQTSRPKSPTIIFHKKPPVRKETLSPAKIVFTETSRPVSPKIMHRPIVKSREQSKSPCKIIFTETSRPLSPIRTPYVYPDNAISERTPSKIVLSETSRPVSPKIVAKKSSISRSQSVSPVRSLRSPSYRRIHSVRLQSSKPDYKHIKPIRARSAGDAENGFRNDPDYDEYLQEIQENKMRSDRFRELNRYYSLLERVGELEKATSNCDLRHRKKDEEIIDFDRWKKIRSIERAEEELNILYNKLKLAQNENNVLFYPRDVTDFRWNHESDRCLKAKEKSVEDLKEHFQQASEIEHDTISSKDIYKPLWRGESVAETAFNINKKADIGKKTFIKKPITTIQQDGTLCEIRKKIGIGSRLWSSLSMEQVNALKNQLNSIYSKDNKMKPDSPVKEYEKYEINVTDTSTEKTNLQVRSNSEIYNKNPIIHEKAMVKSDSISAIDYSCSSVKDIKNNINEKQISLSESEKKKISQTLSQEVLDRIKKIKNNFQEKPATEAITAIKPTVSEIREKINMIRENNLINSAINEHISVEKSPEKITSHPSSASEAETGSSDISNKTVIYKGSDRDVQKKVEYFESVNTKKDQPKTIYHAREDSDDKPQCKIVQNKSLPSSHNIRSPQENLKMKPSQSCASFKDLFGESEKNKFLSLPHKSNLYSRSPSPHSEVYVDDRRTPDTLLYSSNETVCRSRSASPVSEHYWRTYLNLSRTGEVRRLAHRFDSLQRRISTLRRHNSDPEIIRGMLLSNWPTSKRKYYNQLKNPTRTLSPVARVPLRSNNRFMPHIDIISKLAALRRRIAPRSRSADEVPECRAGEVKRIRRRFETMSLLGQIYTSAPDVSELRDIAPYLSGEWIAHQYPRKSDNNKNVKDGSFVKGRRSPIKREAKVKSPPKENIKLSSILKSDSLGVQKFDAAAHRPVSRYEPPRAPPRPPPAAWSHRLAPYVTPHRHTVKFQEMPEPPRRIPGGSMSDSESPRRYVESDVNIHYRCPVRRDPLPLVPERELAKQQAEHMKRLYREQRRAKYLQDINPKHIEAFDESIKELQDMQNRRHQDNFTPAQKTILPLNRYDEADRTLARALYTFTGQTARELSFKKGDIINVRRQVDANWYEGELQGKYGLFPYNYVEILKGDQQKPAPTQKKSTAILEGRARAKFDFTAQTNLELPLKKGEVVILTRKIDHNWWEGKRGSHTGIFPDSYITVLQEPSPSQPELPSGPVEKPMGSPAAHGLMNGSARRTLAAHVYTPQHNSPALANAPPNTQPLPGYTAKPAQATVTPAERGYGPPAGADINNTEPLYVDTNAEAVPYRAMYKYRPQNPDELELKEGDTVYVLEKCDDGWYVGSSQRTGRFGTFPGNYVEKI